MKRVFILCLALMAMTACNKEEPITHPLVGPAFYVWYTTPTPDQRLYQWEFLEDGTVNILDETTGIFWSGSEFYFEPLHGASVLNIKSPVFGHKRFHTDAVANGDWILWEVDFPQSTWVLTPL